MQPHKPILYGPDGLPIVRARSIHAPKPRIGAGLEGWVSWRLVDRRGREVAGGEQHNLILNSFLNALATWTNLDNNGGPYGTPGISALLTHFAVGTSSTTPAVTDTALGSQVGSRVTTLVSQSITRVSECVYDYVVEREFGFADGNGNLTEFGFAAGASSDILIRELFRDVGGDPITVTKTSDYKLRIKYTQRLSLTPTFTSPATSSFTITGIGSVQGSLKWVRGGSADYGYDTIAFGMLAAGRSLANYIQAFGRGYAIDTVPSAYNSNSGISAGSGRDADTRTPSSYTPGSFERSVDLGFGTGQANITIATLGIGGGTNNTSNGYLGLAFVIDSGDRFAKDNLHMLTLDEAFTVAWARA